MNNREISIARLNAKIYTQRTALINYQDLLQEKKSELAKLKKQLAIAKDFIFRCANDISGDWYINSAKCVLQQIEELDK